jgi:hypothetical protein
MRAHADPDVTLIEAMLAPPPLEDARRSLQYWQQRRRSLPFHRRSARREAAEMATRWEARVRSAERVRFEATLAGKALGALGLIGVWEWRARISARGVLGLAWMLVPLRLKLAAGALVAVWLLVATGIMAAFVALLAHFA